MKTALGLTSIMSLMLALHLAAQESNDQVSIASREIGAALIVSHEIIEPAVSEQIAEFRPASEVFEREETVSVATDPEANLRVWSSTCWSGHTATEQECADQCGFRNCGYFLWDVFTCECTCLGQF